ncbi:oleate hydratase [Candidatus Falkowbacteria bacterium]|nr:oleate hydratase [Candidatus Falkowbacteria bacterium]
MKDICKQQKAYIVGGGISSLAAAVYLIDDAGFAAENITIYEAKKTVGGSLDARRKHSSGAYIMTGHRILAKNAFECTYDLLSRVPSIRDKRMTAKDEIDEYNKRVRTYAKARLVEKGKVVDSHTLGLSWGHRKDLVKVFITKESSLDGLRINDFFAKDFFDTNFWLEFSTVFAFQPWSSLAEFRRYIYRSFHALPFYDTMECIQETPYNQHDSMVLPIYDWLEAKGVNFSIETTVMDIDIATRDQKRIEAIRLAKDGSEETVAVGVDDLVFVTLGSMTTNSCFGSMDSAAQVLEKRESPAWNLWEKAASKDACFGRPKVFDDHAKETKWSSFTITFKDRIFFDMMEALTGNAEGTGGGTSFRKSNWLLSLTLPHQPHFLDQPDNLTVCWGYGLRPDNKGNFVDKKMSECSGEEILMELINHLGFGQKTAEILESAICIPCLMPYITSQFSPRVKGDRPQVLPAGAGNFALLGQYCEIPNDIVFTVEYSIRSAQMAVYSLLGLNKKVEPIYKGHYNPVNIYRAIKTLLR